MRKKIGFGLIALLAVTAVAGERYFNRVNGQDIPLPKAPEPEKVAPPSSGEKVDLFEQLKKDLEAKKDAPTFPALPAKKDEPSAPPTLPSLPSAKEATGLPSLPSLPSAKKDEPSAPPTLPSLPSAKETSVTPAQAIEAPKPMTPTEGSRIELKPANPPQETPTSPFPPIGEKPTTKPTNDSIPPFPPANPPMAKEPTNVPEQNATPTNNASALPKQTSTAPQTVSLPKNSPWALSVVMVDGQTILTATVNKKHEFKILCQTLDLQTGRGSLKASGKVQINGDALNGTCEHVSISLMEDRLLLEGKALVTIDRTSSNVSDSAPASFELKGETLNLRISELQVTAMQERAVDAQRVSRSDTPSKVVTASLKLDGTQWTPYGRLRAVKSNDNMWSLEGSNGTVIAYLLAREGGSLERYLGQSISVYGTREREHSGQPVLRVTHIALP